MRGRPGGGGVAVVAVAVAVAVRCRACGGDEAVADERAARRHVGAIKIITTNMREGYLRKNGVPYSENAVITEYVDRLGPEPDGAIYLLIRMPIDDPKYLRSRS